MPVAYGRPGYHVVGVRGTEFDYACTVGIEGGPATAGEAAYVLRPAGGDSTVSLVRIPAYAGRYYRVQADVVDEILFLRVTDVIDDRVIVDQRDSLAAACN